MLLALVSSDPVDHGREQALIVDHGHDREKHDQQGRKGQRLFECLANAVLFGDAVECGRQHDHEQTHDAGFGEMKTQHDDQYQRDHTLHDDGRFLRMGALLGHDPVVIFEYLANLGRQLRTIAKHLEGLEQHAGNQTDDQHGHRYVRHDHEELGEAPTHDLGDQQILRLTDERRHTTERRADGTVHHQAA